MRYEKELAFAKHLAKEAGAVIRENFAKGASPEWKANQTPITETDLTVNSLVIKRVAEAFPEHGVLGEEGNANAGAPTKWVCDPLDGTMPFSHGVPITTFSLALVEDGRAVLGVVYDPFMDRLFYGVVGQGAFLNDESIHVNNIKSLERALIEIDGFPSTNPVIAVGSELTGLLRGKGAYVTSMWATILPAALVAAGKYSGAILNVPTCEDAAAIKVIVEEAGGKVTDLFGNDQRYDQPTKGFIASNGHIHADLVKLLLENNSPKVQ